MKYTTQSDYPINVNFDADGIVMTSQYDAYEDTGDGIEKVVTHEKIVILHAEFREIIEAYKKFILTGERT
jgi:hypothetical protein